MDYETEQQPTTTVSASVSSHPSPTRASIPPELTMTPLGALRLPQPTNTTTVANEDDADARLCVICTEPVVPSSSPCASSWCRADPYWIEMHCSRAQHHQQRHSHLYHADCLALWWFERDTRNCPRCTQSGQPFSVHARSPRSGQVLTRVFEGVSGPHGGTTMLHPLVLCSQTTAFARRAMLPFPTPGQPGWESLGDQMDVWYALVGWPKEIWRGMEGNVARVGLQRAGEVEIAWGRYCRKLEEKQQREQEMREEREEREERWRRLNELLEDGEARARQLDTMLQRLAELILPLGEAEVAGVNVAWGVLPGENEGENDDAA